ncbi:MAG: hypothetical protein JXA38_07340 [Methanosarcinaceae archaeon]|nr:hypothetical protein [Methanosarcinaceae archaeon]
MFFQTLFGGRQNIPLALSQVGCSAGTSDVVIIYSDDALKCLFLADFNADNLRKTILRYICCNS